MQLFYCSIQKINCIRIKKIIFTLFVSLFAIISFSQRTVINIDNNWKFGANSDSAVITAAFNDKDWETVNLPHTWNATDGQIGDKNYDRSPHWYRKQLDIDKKLSDKELFLRFGSANLKTDVFINGKFVGNHIGGYAAFIFDITNFVNFGKTNTISIKVDNSKSLDYAPLSADFTFFGGITRSLELIATNKLFISPLDYASSGVYLTPYNISAKKANIKAKILVGNKSSKTSEVTVCTTISDKSGQTLDSSKSKIKIPSATILALNQELVIKNPVLWQGSKNPCLYNVSVKLMAGSSVLDSLVQKIGIRTYSVSADSGFYLNNKRYPLHGVAMHEDRRDKGRAISDADRKESLDMMSEMGCNYLRLAHYQHGNFTYNYCDSAGIVLWTEVPLINNISGNALFQDNIKEQLKELIKQNYNHPSVCFWGLCNEIDYKGGPNPAPLIEELNRVAKSIDTTRYTVAAAMFDERPSNWAPDIISWNKYFGWYYGNMTDFSSWLDSRRKSHPTISFGVSEYGVGANPHQHEENPAMPKNAGVFHPEEYQNLYHEYYWHEIIKRPYIWSTSVWVAFDFSSAGRNEGDNPGVNDKGLVTQDRSIKKDAYYFYKANWTEKPFVYITSRRFENRPDSLVEVKVYSNCNQVRLIVNHKPITTLASTNRIFKWEKVLLQKGKNAIEVTGSNENTACSDSCVWNFK